MGRSRAILLAFFVLSLAVPPASAQSPSIGRVLAVKGAVFHERGASRTAATSGTLLQVGDVVVSGEGRAKIQLNDGSILSLGENTRMRIGDYQGTANNFTTRLMIDVGTLRALYNRTISQGRFQVETETAVAAVRGTDWLVEVTPGRTSVALVEGEVAVSGKGSAAGVTVVLRSPGEGTDVNRDAGPTPVARWGAARFDSLRTRATFDE
jgi:hypothetical protein